MAKTTRNTGLLALRDKIQDREPVKLLPSMSDLTSKIKRTSMEEVTPPFGERYWDHIGTYKVDMINGEWYWKGKPGHWMHSIHPGEGFFTHADHPEELVRIGGMMPSLGVYLFKIKY